ncbi:hypothetical protein [Kribbella sp. NPDC048915]|uniref:hypothetical protein n=1 Tax=Kribbella sp. NPDC048915 TaxID=3155148 RepID=UPI00340C9593
MIVVWPSGVADGASAKEVPAEDGAAEDGAAEDEPAEDEPAEDGPADGSSVRGSPPAGSIRTVVSPAGSASVRPAAAAGSTTLDSPSLTPEITVGSSGPGTPGAGAITVRSSGPAYADPLWEIWRGAVALGSCESTDAG